MKNGIVLCAEGFEEIEALTAIDLLRRADLSVMTLGVTGKTVTGSHGIPIITDRQIVDIPQGDKYDFIVIPGGMPGAKNIAGSQTAAALIRSVHEKQGLVAAICAAPSVVLYPMGLLNGKKATCFPGMESHWENVQFSEDRVCFDGNLITSRGAGTAMEFALSVIGYLCGKEKADTIAGKILA